MNPEIVTILQRVCLNIFWGGTILCSSLGLVVALLQRRARRKRSALTPDSRP